MTQADSVLSTPPTNTPISQSNLVDGSRRRFLAVAAFSSVAGAGSLAAATMASLGASAAAFFVRAQMNYQAFTNDSLTMMYEAIRGALAADDALKRQGLAIRFRVRETPDWKKHAADLESEMLKRGMRFEVIDWSEDRPTG
jgi:hypothetical protein